MHRPHINPPETCALPLIVPHIDQLISYNSITSTSASSIMTRTERATSPRAILKDRSESKSGMDKHTPKGGAGTHNWGSLMTERDLEDAAFYDQDEEVEGAPYTPYFSRGLDFSRAASPQRNPLVPRQR